MKREILLACSVLLIASCSQETKTEPAAETTSAAAETIDYAYLPANHPPDNWNRGDMKNVALVLKSLKAFEVGNIDSCVTYFANSVHWLADGIDTTVSNEDLKKMLKDVWGSRKSMKIDMADYESVISKDGKDQYVGMWYKETITGNDGKTDSVFHMDDLKIENGKITELDEKTRKFPVPKK